MRGMQSVSESERERESKKESEINIVRKDRLLYKLHLHHIHIYV